jgi:hypothetical protein
MGEKTILVDRGKHTFLTTVFYGKSGKRLYSQSSKILDTLEDKYDDFLESWDGDLRLLKGSIKIMGTMLPPEIDERSPPKK